MLICGLIVAIWLFDAAIWLLLVVCDDLMVFGCALAVGFWGLVVLLPADCGIYAGGWLDLLLTSDTLWMVCYSGLLCFCWCWWLLLLMLCLLVLLIVLLFSLTWFVILICLLRVAVGVG